MILITSVPMSAVASGVTEVGSEAVITEKGKTVLIPVKIKNNPGIMGFKITVSYDKDVLTSPNVTKGAVTENSMMNDSIGVSAAGTFDVIWSNTQDVNGDGTLMTLSFIALEEKDTHIMLSYSQEDTFNETWEDVVLKCTDIAVKFSKSDTQTESESGEKNPLTVPPGSEAIKDAVDIVFNETGKESFDNISDNDKQSFLDRTNEILGQISDGTAMQFENIDEIRDAYSGAVADEFIYKVTEAVNSDEIDAAINASLEAIGVKSIDDIPDEKKQEFVKLVEDKLAQYAPDIEKISDKLSADESVDAIKKLQALNKELAKSGMKIKNNTVTVIILIGVVIAVLIITVTVLHIKRKKKEEAN